LNLWESKFLIQQPTKGPTAPRKNGQSSLKKNNVGTVPTAEKQPERREMVSPDVMEVTYLQPE